MATKWLDYMLIREITDPKYIQQWTAAIMHPVSLLLYTVFCASLPAEQMKVYLRMHVVPKNPSSAIHYVRYLLKYHILSYRIFWSWSIRCAGIKMYLHKKTCFKLSKDCKGIYNVTKIYISNNFLSIKESWKKIYHSFHKIYEAAQPNTPKSVVYLLQCSLPGKL